MAGIGIWLTAHNTHVTVIYHSICQTMNYGSYTSIMSNNPVSKPSYSQVAIRVGGLTVEIGTETQYPDMIDDLSNRALFAFKEAMNNCKENGIDISNMRLITTDYGDELEDDD